MLPRFRGYMKKLILLAGLCVAFGAEAKQSSQSIEAIKQKGHSGIIIDHLNCDILMDDSGPAVFYKGERVSNIDAIIPRIGASVTFYGTAVVRQFEMMNVFSAIDSLAITRSRDKLRSLQILSRAKVAMPKTAFTNSASVRTLEPFHTEALLL